MPAWLRERQRPDLELDCLDRAFNGARLNNRADRAAKEMRADLQEQDLELLNSGQPIEVRVYFDDRDSVRISHDAFKEALIVALGCGAIFLAHLSPYAVKPKISFCRIQLRSVAHLVAPALRVFGA